MHFVYGFCNCEVEGLLWLENRQRYPLCKTFENLERTLKEAGSFPRETAEREQGRRDMFWQQCSEAQLVQVHAEFSGRLV
jgi:hypothetical protein